MMLIEAPNIIAGRCSLFTIQVLVSILMSDGIEIGLTERCSRERYREVQIYSSRLASTNDCTSPGQGYIRQQVLSIGNVWGHLSLHRRFSRIFAWALTMASVKCRPSWVCEPSNILLNTDGSEIRPGEADPKS